MKLKLKFMATLFAVWLALPVILPAENVSHPMDFNDRVGIHAPFSVTGPMTVRQLNIPPVSVALTSPTVTFSAKNLQVIYLSADANLTGVRPIGGTLGQIIYVFNDQAASGANTMRFDDGAYTKLGNSNIILTEGATYDDCIGLMCQNTAGTIWRVIGLATPPVGSFTTLSASQAFTASTTSHLVGAVTADGAVGVTGLLTATGGLALQNAETVTNATNNMVTVGFGADAGILELSNGGTGVDNRYEVLRFSGLNDNVTGVKAPFADIVCTNLDVTSTTYDSNLLFKVQTAGTGAPATAATLTGAALTLASGVGLVAPGGITNGGGTAILKQTIGSLSFAGDGNKTASVTAVSSVPGATGYHVTTNFQTNSANTYVKTAAIASTTLTVTANASTTGTLTYQINYY